MLRRERGTYSCSVVDRVGISIGRGLPDYAKMATYVTMGAGVTWVLLNIILVVPLRGVVASLFSSDPEVIDLAKKAMPILAFFTLGNTAQSILGGVLRGARYRPCGSLSGAVVQFHFLTTLS